MLSIILPCYNEGNKLKNSVEKIFTYLKEINLEDFEIIIVNDGSTDNTFSNMIELKEVYPNYIKLVHYKENKGKGYAIKRGFLEATKEYSLFMDTDLSTDLSAISTVLDKIKEGKQIIIGSRRLQDSELVVPQGFVRKFIGNCCKIITNSQLKLNIKDTQCGFKCFKTEIAIKMALKQTINRWAFDTELLYMARLNNIEIVEIPIKWENDSDSRVSASSASIEFMKDLNKIKKNKETYIFT